MLFTLKRNDMLPLAELPVHAPMTRWTQCPKLWTLIAGIMQVLMGCMQENRIGEACTLGDPLRFVRNMTLLTAPTRLLLARKNQLPPILRVTILLVHNTPEQVGE